MTPTLETRRLVLRPLALADAGQIQNIFPHWEVVRYLSNVVPWPYPADGALTFCRDVALPAIARGQQWHWTLRLKSDPGQIIGEVALMDIPDNHRGFWVGVPWQGQGYMGEAADAVTEYWFNTLGFPVMRVPKAIPNVASRRLSERQGMRLIELVERDYVSGRFPAEVWEITAQEWRARQR